MSAAHRSIPPGSALPVLVGRERELGVLWQHLAASLAGQGSLMLIGGEAGIGKTALAEAVCREAAEQDALVLVGRCYDLTETPPYGPWVDLFATYAPGTDLPALPAPFAQRGTVGAVASQAALFTTVHDFFTALAQQRPLLILLDDLHWADPTSLDLLRSLARSLARLPLLVLVAYRADELTRRHPLYTLLPLLEHDSAATRLDLHPLSPDAVRALVAARYPLLDADRDRLVTYLLHRAEGNALFTLQLLRALVEGDALRADNGGWVVGDLDRIHVPLALRQVIDGRLARLNEEAQRLLAVAAVIGQEVPLDLWATVTERDEDALLEVVEQAATARIVAETEDGTRVRFVHALIREALYEGLSAVRRRRLHAQLGEILIGTASPDPDAVVYHLRAAHDPRLAHWLFEAGTRAFQASAHATAVARYEEALPLLIAPDDAPSRYLALMRLLVMRILERTSIAYGEEAVRVAGEMGDEVRAAHALLRQGFVRALNMDITAGLAQQERAMVTLAAQADDFWPDDIVPVNTAATGRDMLAVTFAFVGRLREAVAALEGAALSASGYFALAVAKATLGRPEAARAALRDFRGTFPATDPRLISQSLRFEEMYVTIPYHADDATAVRQVTAQLEERLGETVLGIPPRMIRLPMLIIQGGWDEAWSYVPLVRRAARTTNAEMRGLTLVGMLARARGERAVVREMVAELFPEGAGHEPGTLPFRYGLTLQETAAALALDDDALPAAKGWLDAHDRWLAWSGAVLGQSEGQALWARYYRQLGEMEKARTHAERALTHATEPRQPLALLAARRLLGELETDAKRYDDAAQQLAGSLALADACAAPYERALTLLALAELRAATGETEAATQLLGEVRAICAPLGAQPALARAEAIAGRLTAPAYPAGLSAREVEVLRLVAQGMTDAAVAERLFLSPRTVGQHLRSIYNKLGVSSRTAATRFAVEHDLT